MFEAFNITCCEEASLVMLLLYKGTNTTLVEP